MKQGHWNRWIVWRWLVPLFGSTTGRFHAPAPKILKCLAGALLLTLLLAAIFLAVPPLPGQAQGEEDWVILYEENFDDGEAQGWELEGEWVVDDGVLIGYGHFWARYTEGNWGDAQINFRLTYLDNTLHANVRVSEAGRYGIGFIWYEKPLLSLYLFKQLWPDTFIDLATGEIDYSLAWDPDTRVEIITVGGNIQVRVNGAVVMEYADPDPLPPGNIAFETLDDSSAQVDDITVYGPPSPPPLKEYVLTMAVDGAGFTEPEVGNHICREGEVVPIMAVPDDGWEFGGWVGAVTDPDNPNTEALMDSDKTVTAYFSQMPPPPVVTPPPNLWPPITPIIGGAAAILVVTLSTRQVIKHRRHKKWQKEAKEEEPQEPCEPGSWCCQKVESKCELARCKLKHLMLVAHDTASGKLSKKEQIQGEIVDGLNRVIAASRRGEKPEKLKGQVTPLAQVLLQQIIEWLRPEPAPRNVSVIGHLEGCKVTYKFILKHCQETRTWGEAEGEWEVTIKEERDEPLSVLPGLEPTMIRMLEQLIAELTRQLMQFIELGR